MRFLYRYSFREHWATFLHYDFRIDLGNGWALSFAISLGPSMRPCVERLAVEMPLHLSKTMFLEGRIPDGQEGAGEVRVWDRGIITSNQEVQSGLDAGCWIFSLQGKWLHGSFKLLQYPAKGREWALTKLPDEHADPNFVLNTILKPKSFDLAYEHWVTAMTK